MDLVCVDDQLPSGTGRDQIGQQCVSTTKSLEREKIEAVRSDGNGVTVDCRSIRGYNAVIVYQDGFEEASAA